MNLFVGNSNTLKIEALKGLDAAFVSFQNLAEKGFSDTLLDANSRYIHAEYVAKGSGVNTCAIERYGNDVMKINRKINKQRHAQNE